jgi:hypothetical protein
MNVITYRFEGAGVRTAGKSLEHRRPSQTRTSRGDAY